MKFVKILFLSAILMISLTTFAYDIEVDGIYYNVKIGEEMTCEVTNGENKYEGSVLIPNEIIYKEKVIPVTEIGSMAFLNCTEVTKVEISYGIKTIGWRSFENCINLFDIDLPSSVEKIDGLAFYGCYNLSKFVIPEEVTNIAVSTFKGCKSLSSINIHSGITEIGSSAFEECVSLTEISIPSSVNKILDDAFNGCSNLTILKVEKSSEPLLLYLEPSKQKSPFGFCPIKKIYISRDMIYKQIQYGSFSTPDVTGDYTLLLGELKKTLETLTIGGSIQNVDLQNGFLNEKYDALETVIIDDGPTYIGHWCFAKCKTLKRVTIGSTITKIDLNAFDECPNLLQVCSLNSNPPVLISNVFTSNTLINGILYVPKDDIAIYTAAEGWKNFWEILTVEDMPNNYSIRLNYEQLELKIGETFQLKADVSAEYSTDKIIIWNTSNEEVAIVSEEGLVTAISKGVAIITASFGEVSAECEVTVIEEAGIESIFSNNLSGFSILSINGILIKKDCNFEDIQALTKGLYIIKSNDKIYKIVR
ncbi:MAG: leucine-rich repeat protein [Paramuribaculum sp.]|nr:leucine-rich repeat protein [Paramuribaculum sp.]